jgi:putative ABC transport system ATP-binding protein
MNDQKPILQHNLSPTIHITDLYKTYIMGDITVHALNNVSLEIYENQVTVILGASGSGKTTLLNMIGGIDSPTKGTIRVDSNQIQSLSQKQLGFYRQEKIGFIFQFYNLIPNLTAQENVEFVLEYVKRLPEKDRANKALSFLKKVGLQDRATHFPYQLSGGEQQRVSIARALAKNPKIILADEPTGELDYRTGLHILEILTTFARNGKSVLIVTHNREIARIAHNILYLRDGKILKTEQNKQPVNASELEW